MMDPSSRPLRKVTIADHIWQAYEDMASQMGSDRDALINQAMFMFARLNGFLDSGLNAPPPPPGPRPVPVSNGTPVPRAPVAPAQPRGAPPVLQPAPRAPPRPVDPPPPASTGMDDDPVRREVQERVLETAAELERLIQNKRERGNPSPSPAPAPEPEDNGIDIDDPGGDAGGAPALYMTVEGGELDRIAKDRFVIGRGKHCDFVINSGKVSREHAVITREGNDYFVEDLGSSNGTWFNKQRIKRRKIEDGDEYFICSDKVKFVFR
ncbi:MAG: FHA domain-containing protein [Myxococcaceae bacterium]|nr:FHA domain-containing protein [Myxococcaceae bacterium]MCA3013909.1 FHA domain-containing protein [Myxococcaceae bacterium]